MHANMRSLTKYASRPWILRALTPGSLRSTASTCGLRAASSLMARPFAPALVGVRGALWRARRRCFEKQAHGLREKRQRHFLLPRDHPLERIGRHIQRIAQRVQTAAQLHGAAQGHHGDVRIFQSGLMFAAAGPFWPCVTSKETFWPSFSDLKPLPWIEL